MTNQSEVIRHWLDNDPLILDTETTGLGNQAEIIEIAILDRQGRPLFDQLVRPARPVPAETVAIHGITDEQLRDKPTWPQIHDQVSALLRGRQMIAYNAPFDARLIDQTCRRYGLRTPEYTPLCAMRAWLVDAGLWDRGIRFARMTAALQLYSVAPQGVAHRAKDDCLTTRALLEAMAAAGERMIAA